MSGFQAYPRYKSSPIPWLKQVPDHWEISPLFAKNRECRGKNIGLKEKNLLSLSYGRIINKDINSGFGLLPESFETYQIVERDDIVFRLTDLQNDQRSLRSAIVLERGIITSAYISIRPTAVSPPFMNYLMRAYDTQKVFYAMGGGLRQSLKFEDLRRIPLVLPSPSEQAEIVAFLDRETTRIDSLIEKKILFIELLKEKRQAVITKAVTKGLDPSVPMKDSGVKWLGDIPIHWETKAIKRFATVNDDVLPDTTPPDYQIEYVEIGDVNEVEGIASSTLVNFSEASSRARRLVRDGDIIISTVRTYLRAIAGVFKPPRNLVVSTGFAVLRPFAIEPDFARYALAADYFMSSVVSHSSGISYPAINASELMSLHAAVPPREDQLLIVEHIKKTNAKIDGLIFKTKRSVELLQEHRAALVTAAVTGKIDVRNSK